MSEPIEDGLRWAYRLDPAGDGTGPARKIGWDELEAWEPGQGPLWVHLEREGGRARRWLREGAGLDEATAEALLAEGTRPRSIVQGGALILILRGINLNPGATPDDMIALRLWCDGRRLISVRHRRLKTPVDVAEELESGRGPHDAVELLVRIASILTERIEPVLENLEDLMDGLEEGLTRGDAAADRARLAEIRRQVISLRRYLSPQRLVLTGLAQDGLAWLGAKHRIGLREAADATTRYVEDLEALRERAAVIHDEIANQAAERLNVRMYVLSVVTAIFLPLGLLTGLLGINVGGMPGADAPLAFWVVCGLLVGIGVALGVAMRWRRWF